MAIRAGSGSGVVVGEDPNVLWAWNQTDTSQFEASPHPHSRDFAGTGNGNLALSVVDRGRVLGNVLRVTMTNCFGGGAFGVLASELTLPSRYVVEVRFLEASASVIPGCYPFYTPLTASTFKGLICQRGGGSSSWNVNYISGNVRNGPTMNGGGLGDNKAYLAGGILHRYEVFRQEGDTPAAWALFGQESHGVGSPVQFEGTTNGTDTFGANIGTGWDGENMTRFGIGGWHGLTNLSGTADFADLRVLVHPRDIIPLP